MPYRKAPHIKTPDELVIELLTGKIGPKDAHPATISQASLQIYIAACEILDAPKPQRAAMIARVPKTLQPWLKKYIIKLHNQRSSNSC